MSTEKAPETPYRVAVVIGSQRATRICPEVSQFVLDVIKTHHLTSNSKMVVKLALLDIATFNLPLTDEAGLPAHITDLPAGYTTEPTRVWSRAVEGFDAFVFVTPQYNWGMPAALKNALDHLFNEWAGKPAMVIAYGGQAGTLSAAQLITVLSGMFMRVVKKPICMKFGDPSVLKSAVSGQNLGLDAHSETGLWSNQKPAITEAWEELLILLSEEKVRPTARSLGLIHLWMETLSPIPDIEKKFAQAK